MYIIVSSTYDGNIAGIKRPVYETYKGRQGFFAIGSYTLQCVAESSIRPERVPNYEVYFVTEPCKEIATKGRLCFDYSELMCACYILCWLNQYIFTAIQKTLIFYHFQCTIITMLKNFVWCIDGPNGIHTSTSNIKVYSAILQYFSTSLANRYVSFFSPGLFLGWGGGGGEGLWQRKCHLCSETGNIPSHGFPFCRVKFSLKLNYH